MQNSNFAAAVACTVTVRELWLSSRHNGKLKIDISRLRLENRPVSQRPRLSTLTGLHDDRRGQQVDSLSTVPVPLQWLSRSRRRQQPWRDAVTCAKPTFQPHRYTVQLTTTTHTHTLETSQINSKFLKAAQTIFLRMSERFCKSSTKIKSIKIKSIYIAPFILCTVSNVLRHGSHSFTYKLHHARLSFVSVYQMAPPLTQVADIQLQLTTHTKI